MKSFLLVCFFLSAFFINLNASEVTSFSTSDNDYIISNCITVASDQIYITNDGMFLYVDQDFIPVYALYSDGINQYKCDIHNNAQDLVTCPMCGLVYVSYLGCPYSKYHSKYR